MTAEAIRGLEFTTFEQRDQDAVAPHVSMLPFTRNLFDTMDFTPMVFADIPNIKRATRNGFELAESVLLLSGIQHFAEVPEGMATVPPYVKAFLQDLPRSWDDSKFVAGFPGKFVVIARKAGNAWYVAGINSEAGEKTLELDLSFIGKRSGALMTDGAGEREFTQSAITAVAFGAPLQGFKAQAEQPVDGRRRQVQRQGLEGGGDQFLGGQHQLGHGNDRHQRRVLDQADQRIAHGRHRHPQRLRQHHVVQSAPVAQAQAVAGPPLAARHALDGAAQALGQVGAGVQAERQDAGRHRRRLHAGVRAGLHAGRLAAGLSHRRGAHPAVETAGLAGRLRRLWNERRMAGAGMLPV
eukprot:gene26189-29583_t